MPLSANLITAASYQTLLDVQHLHLRYAQVLDANDFSAWPDLFTPECLYTLNRARTTMRATRCASCAWKAKPC